MPSLRVEEDGGQYNVSKFQNKWVLDRLCKSSLNPDRLGVGPPLDVHLILTLDHEGGVPARTISQSLCGCPAVP